MKVTPAVAVVDEAGAVIGWTRAAEELTGYPVAMAIWDRDLRCVWFNEAAEQLRDGYPSYRIGRSLAEVVPGIDNEAVRDAVRGVFADGRPTIDREARWSYGGRERVLSVSLLPLTGADGRTLGVCSVALDFSDSKARDHLQLLREAGVRLVSTLDVMSTAQELAEPAVPVLVHGGPAVAPGALRARAGHLARDLAAPRSASAWAPSGRTTSTCRRAPCWPSTPTA